MKNMVIAFLLLYFFTSISHAWKPPKVAQVGLMGPQFTTSLKVNTAGTHAIAAALMAVREINNKTDGLYDWLLPNTILKVAFRSPRSTYLEAVSAALEMSSIVFNGTGILGLIGTSATASTEATAQIFSNTPYKIPQLAYGAGGSDIGHKTLYTYALRTCPSDAYEGRIIARIIKKYFGWSTVVLFASGDTYGNDIGLEFESEANHLGITIESKSTFWSEIPDFSSIINQVLTNGGVLKIFVLLMKAHDAGLLLEQGHNLGLFKQGTQVFVTDYAATSATWAVMSKSADVARIMKGVIGVTPSLATTRKLPSSALFMKRFLSQKSTQYTNAEGLRVCDRTVDDDGNTPYFMGHRDGLPTSPLSCCGIDYSALQPDGSDIADQAFYAYDAAYALAIGLHVALYKQHKQNMTGMDLKRAILNNASFTGATGHVDFQHGLVGVDAYGQGDRAAATDYKILNFDPRSYHGKVNNGAGAWLSTGLWTWQNQFQACDMWTDVLCTAWVFNTRDNSIPEDIAPIINVQMDDLTRTGLRVAASFALAIVVFFMLVMEMCKNTRLIKASQPALMQIVLIGAMLACSRVFLATFDLSDMNCIAGKWLGHLAFAVTFGALLAKIWRVDAVVNSGFRKVRITSKHIQQMLAVVLCLFCAYLLADTIYSKPFMSYNESFDGHNIIRLMKCTNKDQSMTVALFVVEAVVLISGARLCWVTKDAPGAVNDSSYIAISMYAIVFICSVTFPIVYLNIHPTPAMLLMIMAVGFVVATVGCALVIFGPKTALLLEGADVNDQFEVVRPDGNTTVTNNLHALKIKVKEKMSSGGSGGSSKKSSNVVESLPKTTLHNRGSLYHKSNTQGDRRSVKGDMGSLAVISPKGLTSIPELSRRYIPNAPENVEARRLMEEKSSEREDDEAKPIVGEN